MNEDLVASFATARDAAEALRTAHARLAPEFPWNETSLLAGDDDDRSRREGLLMRFMNLLNTLTDHVFRLISEAEGLPHPRRVSKRDLLDDMEALGVVPDADRLFDALMSRNRLAHVYPRAPSARAGQVNRVHAAAPDVLAALDSAEAWARARGLIPVPPPAA